MNKNYQAYLVRLQRGKNSAHWRATLQNAHTGEVIHFANERDMLRYLMEVCAILPVADNKRDKTTGDSID